VGHLVGRAASSAAVLQPWVGQHRFGKREKGRGKVALLRVECLDLYRCRLRHGPREKIEVCASAGLLSFIMGCSVRDRYCAVCCGSRMGESPHTHSGC